MTLLRSQLIKQSRTTKVDFGLKTLLKRLFFGFCLPLQWECRIYFQHWLILVQYVIITLCLHLGFSFSDTGWSSRRLLIYCPERWCSTGCYQWNLDYTNYWFLQILDLSKNQSNGQILYLKELVVNLSIEASYYQSLEFKWFAWMIQRLRLFRHMQA